MQGPQGSRARDGRVSISTISSNTRFISAAHADGRNCPGSTRIWWRRSGRRARISLGGAPSVPREVSGIWVSPAPQSPQSRLLLPPPLSCSPIVLCTSIHVFAASVRLTDRRHFCQITLERRLPGGQGRAGEVTHPVLRNVELFGSITFTFPVFCREEAPSATHLAATCLCSTYSRYRLHLQACRSDHFGAANCQIQILQDSSKSDRAAPWPWTGACSSTA